ncbi:MAG TPA: class I SAM-dependent methyltransferase [Pirellulales bacterium]|nr:class I SAM-dependent methyltransferase [Pirellulales bacterium]
MGSPSPREHVRAAAERLVADLVEAEQLTSQWKNEPLSFALVETALDGCLASLAATQLWGRDNQALSSEFWAIAGPRLECGPMQLRARTKPRGYAGDHELFAWICDGYETEHPLGRLFDRYFQQQAAVEAVRARTDQLAAAIATRVVREHRSEVPFKLVNVGAGPAIDVERALNLLGEPRSRRLAVTLLDVDGEALAHARQRLTGLVHDDQLMLVRDNLYRLADKPNAAAPLAGADLVICAGFFDYLADEPAAALLQLFWQQLAPGGMLLVGNFAPHCPTRAYMEWIGNWYLIYRTAADLVALAERAGIPASCRSVGAERLGLDLFLCARSHEEGQHG